jgi:Secretion system C-terminal sorting domain
LFLNSIGDTLFTKKISSAYTYFGLTSASPIVDETDSSIIFTCLTNDTTNNPNAYLSKLNSTGDTLWTKIIGGTGYDCFHTILSDTSGYYFIGLTNSFGAGSYDVWFVKTARNGTILQTTAIGNAASNQAISACWSDDGNILISGAENSDDLLMKVDRSGNVIWRQVYPLGMGQCFVTTDSSSAIYLASSTIGPAGFDNLVLRKTDSTGTIIWERTYINTTSYVASINPVYVAANGLLYLSSATTTFSITKGFLWCFTPNGDSLWSVTYESTPGLDAYFYHLSPFPGGGFLMLGFTDSPTQYNNAWLVRVDSNGCFIPGCLTSVEELEQAGSGGLQLMPNPASNIVSIAFKEQPTAGTIFIYNAAGALVLSQLYTPTIDISHFAEGLYFVNLLSSDGSSTGKLVISR